MNRWTFEELKVGMTDGFSVKVTQEMQDEFGKLTGDVNPIHIDPQVARGGGYSDRLVYGMCTASFFSTLVGVYLPGEKCIFQECSVKWPRPVYIGDTLHVCGKIVELDERFRRVKIKAHIVNQCGEKVVRADLVVGVRN